MAKFGASELSGWEEVFLSGSAGTSASSKVSSSPGSTGESWVLDLTALQGGMVDSKMSVSL